MRTLTPSTFTIAALYQSIMGKTFFYDLILPKKCRLPSSHTQISFNQCALLYFLDTLVFWINAGSRIIKSTVLCFSCSFHFSLSRTLFSSLCVITKWAIDLSHVAFKGLTVYNCSRPTVQFSVKTLGAWNSQNSEDSLWEEMSKLLLIVF